MDGRKQVQEQLTEVYQYKGAPLYVAFIKLLQLLDEQYDEDLRTVSQDKLGLKQGASRQLRILRQNLIDGRENDIPKL